MSHWKEQPVFIMTSDVDWASEYCINDFLSTITNLNIRPTVFVTHESNVISKFQEQDLIDIGVHPNFREGSSHGSTMKQVINTVFDMVPTAETFRSHAFYDSYDIAKAMKQRGIRYDSNLCLYLQSDLVPLKHCAGITRYPVFWEDDVHWENEGSWNFSEIEKEFFSPGLKVINVHPFMFTLNSPNQLFYDNVKPHVESLNETMAEEVRFSGLGVRSFVLEMIKEVHERGHYFLSLKEVYNKG